MLRFALTALLLPLISYASAAAESQSNREVDLLHAALQRLTVAPNYGWIQKIEDAGSEVFTVEGKAERGGYVVTQRRSAGTVTRAARKGSVTVVEKQDGQWETEAEVQADLSKLYNRPAPKPNYLRTPIDEITALLPHLTNIAAVEGGIESRIDGEAVALRFPGIRTIRVAQARFWVSSGILTKYELRFDLDLALRGQVQRRDQKVSVTIAVLANAEVEVPAGAREKLITAPPE